MWSSVFVLLLTFLSSNLGSSFSLPLNSNHTFFPFLSFHVLFLSKLTVNDLAAASPRLALPSPLTTLPFYLLALDVEVSSIHCVWSYRHLYASDLRLIHLQISLVPLTLPSLSFFWSSLLFFPTHRAVRMLCRKTPWPMWLPTIHLLLSLSSSIVPVTVVLWRQWSQLLPLVFTKVSKEKN